jgi:hypothetical protein
VTVFRGTTLISVGSASVTSSGAMQSMAITFVDSPSTASSVTYSVRIGASGSTTTYVNQGTSATWGGTGSTAFLLEELV